MSGETCGYAEQEHDGGWTCGKPAVGVTAWWMDRRRDAVGEEFLCPAHAEQAVNDDADVEDIATGRPRHRCPDCWDSIWGRSWGRCEACLVDEAVAA